MSKLITKYKPKKLNQQIQKMKIVAFSAISFDKLKNYNKILFLFYLNNIHLINDNIYYFFLRNQDL